MTNTALINQYIEATGLKRSYIAKTIGISRAALANKISNRSDFKASEIDTICKILGINTLEEKESIFFAVDVAG